MSLSSSVSNSVLSNGLGLPSLLRSLMNYLIRGLVGTLFIKAIFTSAIFFLLPYMSDLLATLLEMCTSLIFENDAISDAYSSAFSYVSGSSVGAFVTFLSYAFAVDIMIATVLCALALRFAIRRLPFIG